MKHLTSIIKLSFIAVSMLLTLSAALAQESCNAKINIDGNRLTVTDLGSAAYTVIIKDLNGKTVDECRQWYPGTCSPDFYVNDGNYIVSVVTLVYGGSGN